MYFTGLGTALPSSRFTQDECWRAVSASRRFDALSPLARSLVQRVLLGDNGIRTRHLSLDRIEEAFDLDPDVLHRRYARHAPELATRAAQAALRDAGIAAREVDALLVSTCTGYLCPGLTSYVAERLGLRADIVALDLVGQGCGAALPNLRAAHGLVSSSCSNALSVCVEVCSAAMYLDNDPGVLISACLFGDGAAAAVLARSAHPAKRSVRWVEGFSLASPADRDSLRMETRGGMLRNILSSSVPQVAARHASIVLQASLASLDVQKNSIKCWLWHAGGRTVLDRLRDALELEERDVARSREALARYGNLSSPFVLFVLEAALREGAPGGTWWMSSFGAGFSCHGALIEVA